MRPDTRPLNDAELDKVTGGKVSFWEMVSTVFRAQNEVTQGLAANVR